MNVSLYSLSPYLSYVASFSISSLNPLSILLPFTHAATYLSLLFLFYLFIQIIFDRREHAKRALLHKNRRNAGTGSDRSCKSLATPH